MYLMKMSAGMNDVSAPRMWLMLSSSRAQLDEALAGSMARRKGSTANEAMIVANKALPHGGAVVSDKMLLTPRTEKGRA